VTTAAQQKIIQGARNPTPQMISAVKTSLGLATDDEARGIIELQAEDPEGAKMFIQSLGARSRSGGL
jgi:hypothetical protein